MIFQYFRVPADWNCFFDNCYERIYNFMNAFGLVNDCAAFGITFGNTFTTRNDLAQLIDCYILFIPLRLNNDPTHYSRDSIDLAITLSYIYVYDTSISGRSVDVENSKQKDLPFNNAEMTERMLSEMKLNVTKSLTRFLGADVSSVNYDSTTRIRKWPWSCSLRSSGHR